MKRTFLAAAVLTVTACSNSVDKALDEASALTSKLCACPDMACAEKVKAELEALQAKEPSGDEMPTGKQTQRAVEIALKWDECMEKAERKSR